MYSTVKQSFSCCLYREFVQFVTTTHFTIACTKNLYKCTVQYGKTNPFITICIENFYNLGKISLFPVVCTYHLYNMYSKTNIFLLFIYTIFVQCATKKKHFQFVPVCRVQQILFPAGTNEHGVCNVLIALQCTLAA